MWERPNNSECFPRSWEVMEFSAQKKRSDSDRKQSTLPLKKKWGCVLFQWWKVEAVTIGKLFSLISKRHQLKDFNTLLCNA